ncbi:hypothetical protein B0A69_21500 [Chryseobacterium shigense]|uniref:Redox-active disulfide protein 2 n=1 Tax=Chryseobacterium shigense TaxID=297244 RepID=A0A1N7IJ78_9FLAO|nr:hypothetical protein [Chryseobacterium shigense]PQA89999.1 hypothetical protein B0A69_21500 [Chryseobacterium shigense]SIS37145.1 hypothetical protein SAMN05421639_10430 [Chryseobacterium shigense]
MKNKLITECTDEELLNNEKKLKIMTILLGVFMVLLFFATMVLTIKKGFTPIVIVPICLLPLFIIGMMNWKRVNKEKERRNLQ